MGIYHMIYAECRIAKIIIEDSTLERIQQIRQWSNVFKILKKKKRKTHLESKILLQAKILFKLKAK